MTVWMIFGILVIMVVAFLFLMVSQKQPVAKLTTDKPTVQLFVQNCLDATTKYALFKAGMQGGYTELTRNFYVKDPLQMAYGHYIKNMLISEDELQIQLENSITSQLLVCLQEFRAFDDKDYEIKTEGVPKVSVALSDSSVDVTAEYTVKIINQKTETLDKFHAETNIPIKRIRNEQSNILDDELYNLDELGKTSGNTYVLHFSDSDIVVYEDPSKLDGQNFLFAYAVKN